MMREESADGFQLHGWLNWDVSGSHGFGSCGRDGDCTERNGSHDPIDLLPVDPFGMNLGTTMSEVDLDDRMSEAIAGWIGYNMDDYEVYNDDLVAGLSYYWSRALLSSFENQVNYGSPAVEFFRDDFLGSVLDASAEGCFEAMTEILDSCRGASTHPEGDVNSLHDGLLLSLGYLGVRDLLNAEGVCRSLRSAVRNDSLLWRCIYIGWWGEKITDDDLYQLTQRAQGNLQYLTLMHCPKITDNGLKRVLDSNLLLKKLSIPGCMRLTPEGIISNLKAAKSSRMSGIKALKLGVHFIGSVDDFEELRLLVDADEAHQTGARKPQFYHDYLPSLGNDDDGLAIDVEICPRCQKCRLVFDCPSEGCTGKGPEHCRACSSCIERCIGCGRCVENCRYTETFFFHNICSACMDDSQNVE